MVSHLSNNSIVVKYGPTPDLRVTFTIKDNEDKAIIRADVLDKENFFSDVPVKAVPKSALFQSAQKIINFLQNCLVDFVGQAVLICPANPLSTYESWKTKLKEEKRPEKAILLKQRIASLESNEAVAKVRSGSPYSFELRHDYILLGDKYLQLRRYPEAMGCYQKSLQNIYVCSNNSRLIGCAYGSLGVLYKEMGDVRRSLLAHVVSVKVGVEFQIFDLIMKGHLNVGSAYMSLNDAKAALGCFKQHIQLAKQLGKSDELPLGYHNLGGALDSLGHLKEAIVKYKKALSLTKGSSAKADLYVNLGETYNRAGLYKEAIAAYQDAELHYEQDGIESPELQGALANVYSHLGEFKKALGHCKKALQMYQKLGNRLQEALVLESLGTAYHQLSTLEKEKGSLFHQKLEKTAHHSYWQKAVDSYQKSYAIADELKHKTCACTALLHLAEIHFSAGFYEKAFSFFDPALKLVDKDSDPFSWMEAHQLGGKLYLTAKEFDRAEGCFRSYLSEAEKIGSPLSQGSAYFYLGILERNKKQFFAAAKNFEKSVKIFSEMQKSNTAEDMQKGVSFFESTVYPYRLWEKTLLDQLDCPQIFSLDENVGSLDRTPPSHLEIVQIADLGKASALVNLLKKKHGLADAALISVEQIQKLVKTWQTTLIVYSCDMTDIQKASCWIVSQDGVVSYRSLELDLLYEELNFTDKRPSFLRSFSEREEELSRAFGKVSECLDWFGEEPDMMRGEGAGSLQAKRENALKIWYKVLILPIKDLLPQRTGDRLTIIPDLTIHKLPFEAFTSSSGKTLIDQFAIQMIPSIETFLSLELLEKNNLGTRRSDRACILANPTNGKELKGAEEEGRVAQEFFSDSVLFTNEDATKENLMQHISSAGVIHLACHGQHVDSQGRLVKKDRHSAFEGGLFLSDGTFYAEDLMETTLNADLAVLSACDSGKGKLWKEGVVGLAHAFLASGASSVIATRWEIPDSKAKIVMEEFYRLSSQETELSSQAKAEGRPFGKVEALREAILKVKRQGPSNVRNWGGFFLTGLPD